MISDDNPDDNPLTAPSRTQAPNLATFADTRVTWELPTICTLLYIHVYIDMLAEFTEKIEFAVEMALACSLESVVRISKLHPSEPVNVAAERFAV